MRANQTMMDVVGNNIANVNTIGYKSSSAMFEDTLSQMLQGASAPTATARRHQPGPGRPRRPARRHHHQLHPGCGRDHRPLDRPDAPGRRLLHHARGRPAGLHPQRLLRLRRQRQPGQRRRRPGPGLAGDQRQRRHQGPAEQDQPAARHDGAAGRHDDRELHRQPALGRRRRLGPDRQARRLRRPGQRALAHRVVHQGRRDALERLAGRRRQRAGHRHDRTSAARRPAPRPPA